MEAHEAPPPAAAAAPSQQQQAPNLPPPRLIISEIVLENFKSYAGVQRVGPFHKVCCFGSLFFFQMLCLLLRRGGNGFTIWRGRMRQAKRVLLVDRSRQRGDFETCDALAGSL